MSCFEGRASRVNVQSALLAQEVERFLIMSNNEAESSRWHRLSVSKGMKVLRK